MNCDCTCLDCAQRQARRVLVQKLDDFAQSLKPLNYCGIQLDAEDAEELVFMLEFAAAVIKERDEPA